MFTGLFTDANLVSPYAEYSKADLVWSIAAGPSDAFSPNVLSELSYTNVESQGVGIGLIHLNRLSDRWAVFIEADYADTAIQSGRVQDSDYLSDDREDEFLRSYAEVKDDNNQKLSLSLGLKTRWFGKRGHYATALLGHQRHFVNLTMTNGVWAIPEEYEGVGIPGLKSTYDSDFQTWYAGLATEHRFNWGIVGLRYEYHDLVLDAEADWNLREDFAHPVSFAHTGEGYGHSVTLGYSYPLSRQWDLYADYNRTAYRVKDGFDQTIFADGSSYVTRLNKLEYDSDRFRIGFRYIFYSR